MEKSHFGAHIEASIERPAIIPPQRALIHSIWDVEHWRKDFLLSQTRDHNTVTNEGLDALLDIMFHAATQCTTWYVLIFETDTTPAAGTTYAVPVFTETNAAYDEATRVEYVEAAASSQSLTNSANKATFTMNDTKTIYGAALVGKGGVAASTKGDVALADAFMYCASKFASSKAVISGDSLKVSITLTGADA